VKRNGNYKNKLLEKIKKKFMQNIDRESSVEENITQGTEGNSPQVVM
jgi:hypothetical protein